MGSESVAKAAIERARKKTDAKKRNQQVGRAARAPPSPQPCELPGSLDAQNLVARARGVAPAAPGAAQVSVGERPR